MGLFQDLLGKIFHHAAATPAQAPTAQAPAPDATSTSAAATQASTAAPAAAVDVTAILDKLAKENAQKLDWRHSIVDLMKLVGMDSSLTARKSLAAELHYTGDTADSAAMNMWLHKQVIKKLAENGGRVPKELLD